MKVGRKLHQDIYMSALDDMNNELHCDKLENVSPSFEESCDNILYNIVEDTIEQFSSNVLIEIILYL
jgi:hypothetical protein